jgi:hypothetical protein
MTNCSKYDNRLRPYVLASSNPPMTNCIKYDNRASKRDQEEEENTQQNKKKLA